MPKITIQSNVKKALADIDKRVKKMKQRNMEALAMVAKETFRNSEALVTPALYKKDKIYTTPPGANIQGQSNRFRTQNGWVKSKFQRMLYITGQVVSRSGSYLESIKKMANGALISNDFKIVITKNKLEIYARNDKTARLERAKGGSKARRIIGKSLSKAKSAWASYLKKKNKEK